MTANNAVRRIWVCVPARAVRVSITLDRSCALDALETTVLRLLRISPRSAGQLEELLGLSHDLIRSALERLQDLDLVVVPEHQEGRFGVRLSDADDELAAEVASGWAFYVPAGNRVLPYVLESASLPSPRLLQPYENIIRGDGLQGCTWPDRKERSWRDTVRAMLAGAVLSPDAQCFAPPESGGGQMEPQREESGDDDDEWDDAPAGAAAELRLPAWNRVESEPRRMRALLFDDSGRSPSQLVVDYAAWIAVDLLPTVAGRATPVFHDPTVAPLLFPERPVSPTIGPWLQAHDLEAWRLVEAEAEKFRLDLSVVLQRAGIADENELDRQTRAHWAQVASRCGGQAADAEVSDGILREEVFQAQRWLIISQRESEFVKQVRDRYAHAIERLMKCLLMHAKPSVEEWYGANPKPGKKDLRGEQVERRIDWLDMRRGLESSMPHLKRAAKDLGSTVKMGEDAGAGACLVYFLLPLILLADGEANQYAEEIRAALRRDPSLFERLDLLVQVRNHVFHGRAALPVRGEDPGKLPVGSLYPEEIDENLVTALVALSGVLNGAR